MLLPSKRNTISAILATSGALSLTIMLATAKGLCPDIPIFFVPFSLHNIKKILIGFIIFDEIPNIYTIIGNI